MSSSGEESAVSAEAFSSPEEAAETSYGCQHYRRKVQIIAPCCSKVYTCRLCHDEEENDNQRDIRKAHKVDRKAIRECICLVCGVKQAPARICYSCETVLGNYFCAICNLWDDQDKQQFHCDQCGICRLGGAENFRHCQRCGMCLSIPAYEDHNCRSGSGMSDCPICMEEIFASTTPACYAPCGHWMHIPCREQYIRSHNFTCPLCSKSLLPRENTQEIYRAIEAEVERWPMPEEARYTVTVYCNDCEQQSETQFHPIALRCEAPAPEQNNELEEERTICGSYNTRRVS